MSSRSYISGLGPFGNIKIHDEGVLSSGLGEIIDRHNEEDIFHDSDEEEKPTNIPIEKLMEKPLAC
jgi:hypothetical protein